MGAEPLIRSYRDLRVWKAGIELADCVYELTESFPRHEIYGLSAQLRRAAVSVPANIAEGYGRGLSGDYVRLLRIANGSLKELETELIIAAHRGFVSSVRSRDALELADATGRMLASLIRTLAARRPKTEDRL